MRMLIRQKGDCPMRAQPKQACLNQPMRLQVSGFARLLECWSDIVRISERTLAPIVDLVIRVHLAQIFFVSGVLKASDWDHAIFLATNEYPVAWMDPVTAAYLGGIIELVGSVLLAAGLATRIAAVMMLALSAVIQINYVALDANLFWIVLFGWYAVRGAGSLSIDCRLQHGLSGSALPLAQGITGFTSWISAQLGPLYQLAFRLWLSASLAFVASSSLNLGVISEWSSVLVDVLALKSASMFPTVLSLSGAVLLGLGLGTRAVALSLLAATLAKEMQDPALADDWYWLACFSILGVYGAGIWSLDACIKAALVKVFPQLAGRPVFSLEGLPRVVIVGAGFGGVTCAAALRNVPVAVTLIDKHNYHLFQPLLYQVATTMLAPNDIASPIRGMFRDNFNVRVLLGEVEGVDTKQQEVLLSEQRVPYDYLVLATGASHSYFGRDEWEPFAPGLKRIEDATDVRRRLLTAFERAESAQTEVERRALLTFLIVGGGPTGVELAGAIAELARHGMEHEFRHIDPASAKIVLVQAAPRILPMFPESLSEKARRTLENLGIDVRLNSRVENIDADGVIVSGERIRSRTVFWAAGVVASPAAKWISAEDDGAGRVKVNPDLSVPGFANVFAVGDTALSTARDGKVVPGLAPAAKQGGAYVARLIRTRVLGEKDIGAFRYKHLGSLATIGRKAAIADFGTLRLSGAIAWWLWGAVHVAFLVGLRNRVSVMFDWFWAYLTFRSGTRLITGTLSPASKHH